MNLVINMEFSDSFNPNPWPRAWARGWMGGRDRVWDNVLSGRGSGPFITIACYIGSLSL